MRVTVLFLLLWQFTFTIPDAGISVLIVFLHHLLKFLSLNIQSKDMSDILASFPSSIKAGRSLILGPTKSLFIQYVVCSMCHSLYDLKHCIEHILGQSKQSKKCQYVQYPNHAMEKHRSLCGNALLKKVRLKSGETLKPFKVYCYQSLQNAVQKLVKRKGFIELCEMWRNREIPRFEQLSDIYDGNVWHTLKDENQFLSQPNSWCVTMNVDWFQPFTHITDSVGAIYLVIQNLPRSYRYLRENIILVGIIPGPKEPKLNINSYLTPLVLELQEFYNGIKFSHPVLPKSITIRIALTCVACDLPALRKVVGFVGHNAKKRLL